jgi:hypothetical protein
MFVVHQRVIALAALLLLTPAGRAAVQVGTGPTFSYRYSPRETAAADTNAIYNSLRYFREPPSSLNCSFFSPLGTTNFSSGTATYLFQTASGFVIEHAVLFQRANLFAPGAVWGDFSVDGGAQWQRFFSIRPYGGSPISYERQATLRNVNTSNLFVRYTLVLTNGFNFNVQVLRDCDDATSAFLASGTVITRAEAARRVSLVRARSTWRYLDNGSNQGTAWRQPEFNYATWAAGPAELGYGDSDEATRVSFGPNEAAKYVTTYFRHTFQATNVGAFENLSLGLLVDDGAVVYLNGQEVYRTNMPAGAIGYQTYAATAFVDPRESSFNEATISPTLLVPGTNVIAVEVHQATADSSDLSFDLDLRGLLARPRLAVRYEDNCVVLSGLRAGYVLEEASNLRGPWNEVTGNPTETYFVCGELVRGFYRLKSAE